MGPSRRSGLGLGPRSTSGSPRTPARSCDPSSAAVLRGVPALRNYLKTTISVGGGTRAGHTPVGSGPGLDPSVGTRRGWSRRTRPVPKDAAGRELLERTRPQDPEGALKAIKGHRDDATLGGCSSPVGLCT